MTRVQLFAYVIAVALGLWFWIEVIELFYG